MTVLQHPKTFNTEVVTMKKSTIAVLCMALSLSGCATVGQSVLLGVGTGAAAGTGAGLIVQKSPGSALIGAGIGAVVGGALGYLFHKKSDPSGPTLKDSEVPFIKKPEANCIRLKSRVEGPLWFGPQLKCTIDKPAVWSK
jgi:hypothetical protein